MSRLISLAAASLLCLTVLLLGACSSSDPPPPGAQLNGVVQTGGTSGAVGLAGAAVYLYEAMPGAPVLLASATSDAAGNFSLGLPTLVDDSTYYVRAELGGGIVLLAVLGGSVPATVTVNELTTVAAAFCFARFVDDVDLFGDPLALQIASGMNANLVDVVTGLSSPVLLATPNGDETNSLRSTRSLANLIAGCIDEPTTQCPIVFGLTTPTGGTAPTNTLQALVSLARNPAHNVSSIYAESQVLERYVPPLAAMPDAWTLTVKVNQTGSAAHPFGGAANTVFDEQGYAWINNNVVQGESTSAMSVIVLKPDGSPADGANGAPSSPVLHGGVLGGGFGITRNKLDGSIWVGNFGWGDDNPGPEGNGGGSVSQFAADGSPVSTDIGYDGGTDRVQGTVADADGNIWMASYGNDKLVVFLAGDSSNAVSADAPCKPFGIALAPDGTAWLATAGGGLPGDSTTCDDDASMSHWRLDSGALEMLSLTPVGDGLKGVDVDLDGYAWVASGGDDTVYRLDPDGMIVGTYQGGGISAPWSVRIDDDGNVWVANFGLMTIAPPNNIYANASLSVLAGPSSPSGLAVGEPISPPTGYTLPSAGAPVLLSDGTPLSQTGDGMQPALTPLMRSVSSIPDRAGNVWVTNNWKPNFTSDLIGDPGGDGMVIFIGLAAPTEPGRTQ